MASSHWGYAHFFKFRYHFYDLVKYIEDSGMKDTIRARLGEYVMNETYRIGQIFEAN